MKVTELRDNYETKVAADDQAAAELSAAQNKKVQTSGDRATATISFAHGIKALGGRVIDIQANPPVLYVTADGETFTRDAVPSLDSDIGGEVDPTPSA